MIVNIVCYNVANHSHHILALSSIRVFLASEFQTIVPTLEKLIPESKHGFLSQYNSQVRIYTFTFSTVWLFNRLLNQLRT